MFDVLTRVFMDPRHTALDQWLQTHCQLTAYQLDMMAGDASFRRYFRVRVGSMHYVAMDAPPEKENNCRPFIAIAESLRQQGLHAPEIIASDIEQGFLLLTDFGDKLYLKELTAENAESLYATALDALATLQGTTVQDWEVPPFTADFMYCELQLSKEWFLVKHLGLNLNAQTEKMLADFFLFLAKSAAAQPQVLMHRDYHSANLMLLPDNNVGILDFQDAFIGPVTYDLASLLRDCYIVWPDTLVKNWALQYKEKISPLQNVSDSEFMRWFDLMGMQRHLKALLTYARKFHRDDNANYLQHIPRTLQYLALVAPVYGECRGFNAFLQNDILPAAERVSSTCVQ
jgi:aminoglycoside/choline kinase family phosphotransferase